MTCQGCLCWGSDRKLAKRLRGGVGKSRRARTDLIVPRTVQLTQQTPVVANHAVKKMSHGCLHWENLRPVRPGDTLRRAAKLPRGGEEGAGRRQQQAEAASPSASPSGVLRPATIAPQAAVTLRNS